MTNDYDSDVIYCWGIQLDDKIIGFAMVADVHERNDSIAFYLGREYWSEGYASEAVAAIMAYMFVKVGLNRFAAKHSIKNTASGKVLRIEGMLRSWNFIQANRNGMIAIFMP